MEGNSLTCVKCRGIVIGIPVPKGQMLCGSTRMRYVNEAGTQKRDRRVAVRKLLFNGFKKRMCVEMASSDPYPAR